MARKGENIYKRKDGRYEGRYIKGRKPDGKPEYGYVYGYKYKDVKAKLTLLKAAYEANSVVKIEFTGTFWDWSLYWLEDLRKPSIKESTYASYRNKLQNHILPLLGNKKLDQITPELIQNFVYSLSRNELSPSSIGLIFRILNNILEKASDRHLIFGNPCKNIQLPKITRKRVRAFTLNEQKVLEDAAWNEPGCSAVILGNHTGMRIGELSALRWNDIDFESRTLHVKYTMQRIPAFGTGNSKTKVIVGTPKSDGSARSIPLSPVLCSYLKKCKEDAKSEYVISCNGHYAEPRVINYRFKATLKNAGLSEYNFHCMRHTFATRCLEQGVDVATVSALLGHSSAKMTLDTYADSMMAQRKAAVTGLDTIFNKENLPDVLVSNM